MNEKWICFPLVCVGCLLCFTDTGVFRVTTAWHFEEISYFFNKMFALISVLDQDRPVQVLWPISGKFLASFCIYSPHRAKINFWCVLHHALMCLSEKAI